MKYLIVQDWPNTSGNHAGMVHMCRLLTNLYPEKYKVVVMKDLPTHHYKRFVLIRKTVSFIYKYYGSHNLMLKKYLYLCRDIWPAVKAGDEFFLLEYLFPGVSQYKLAKYIRTHYPGVHIYGLAHLTPTILDSIFFFGSVIRKWVAPLDKILTLGTSLSRYLQDKGNLSEQKISTGFHYVDSIYYHREHFPDVGKVTIIIMGSLQRNFQLIASIVKKVPEVNWIICQGSSHYESLFADCPGNISLKGFMSEDELRQLMSESDLSLNVMVDTVGSNVITTSMAMGLGLIVSDVGSIRDYCSAENAVFCKNEVDSFVSAIKPLVTDKERVDNMKRASCRMAESLNVRNVDEWFDNL